MSIGSPEALNNDTSRPLLVLLQQHALTPEPVPDGAAQTLDELTDWLDVVAPVEGLKEAP